MTLTGVKISFTNGNNQHLATSSRKLEVDRADFFIDSGRPWAKNILFRPEKIPDNRKKTVLDYRDCGIVRNY